MKDLKKIMIILIIFMIIIVSYIIYIINNEKQNILNEQNLGDKGDTIEFNKSDLEDVTDRSRFFTVRSCVQEFLDEVNENNTRYFSVDENNQLIKIVTSEEINQSRYNLLSEDFINTNNITIDNINNYLKVMNTQVVFDALNMKYLKGEKIENYVVYGIMTTLSNDYVGELYIRVNLDRENKTFAIEPLYKENNFEDIKITYSEDVINKNSDNLYSEQNMTYEDIAKEYLLLYKRIMLAQPERIYNDYFLEEYKSNRFGNIDNFKEYEKNNKDEISKIQIKKYDINNYKDYMEIVCMDQYQNLYIFNENIPMQFTIKLDTYTIMTDEFKDKYDSVNNQQKVAMNIEKWIQMLNSRDYNNAYNVLDEEFRKNNWKTEGEFEEYIKNKMPLHYSIKYTTYSNDKSVYVQTIELTDVTGEVKEEIVLNIIMVLEDKYDFIMSFSID